MTVTLKDRGTLYSTGGDDSWPVTYRIHTNGENPSVVLGTLKFPAGTRLGTLNPNQPVYLRLNDGRWARLYLPVEAADETSYMIGDGSRLGEAPSWEERSR